ncbi:DNA mismatch repair endonuclease MutL [Paracidobacterium acidisoli]|uniref:DNA mismatch repair protein MutL n=1 Tax=Paracidobacterium acidisoli TaxID=2303751 RepID=A0A372INL2_9BACT|nr:DNA mismatch repair endonuclease MutL [Paracidobacterium acidisoli]MBT9332159.1 DNA mismatch repair endonuclease MutL [Paracidobacterium acidisoli]
MGKIRVLSDQVANQIAAGEVVDRPASVVKELLENALDAGASRIRIEIEGGGRRLIRITDDGSGMSQDDAMLAFERHATSKIRSSDDLLSIATLGFRGEALPSIASISRLELLTRSGDEAAGTRVEIAGGRVVSVEEAGAPAGTTIAVRDLFFNTPARRKFLKAESTELSHVTALVTHYALAHPERHFELHSATHALLIAPPVREVSERIYQIFGRDTLDQLVPMAAERRFDRAGVPEPPPWRRDEDYVAPDPGFLRVSGFVSKPALQKLNRNSIYVFVNQRLIRDRLILHAVSEAYRNIIPPTSFPVILMFLEMPAHEVDVNVHPAKTEVRFRQQSLIHDFVRDGIRNTLMKARPAAEFLNALTAHPLATPSLSVSPMPGVVSDVPGSEPPAEAADAEVFILNAPVPPPQAVRLPFAPGAIPADAMRPVSAGAADGTAAQTADGTYSREEQVLPEGGDETGSLHGLASLKPLGQLRESFILAVNDEGFWIVDQHVAHERVLFEKILRERDVERTERQRLLMPMLIDLQPHQMVVFADMAGELERNGFEVEPFGPHTIAVKAAPAGLEGGELERMLMEVLEQQGASFQSENLETARTRIAASIACHAAIKINTPLDPARMEWLLAELARTEHPTSCPHGRPIALRYSWKDIQRAFHRI